MAKSFAVTTTATDTLKADAQGRAEALFTVTNTTPRPIRGIVKAKALGDTKQEWLSLAGDTERDFAAGATHQFTVSFDAANAAQAPPATPSAARAGSSVPAGKYPFRLDVASARNPDEDFTEGPTVNVEVAAAAPPAKKSFPLWIIPVIAVVLLVVGITLWLLLRTKTVKVPDVVNKTGPEATSQLENSKLKASVTEKVTGTVAAGRVASQDPTAGTERVPEGSTVMLVVEAKGVVISFADSASSARWINDVGQGITPTDSHDGLPQGSVVNRDNEMLENDTRAMKVFETHPRWQIGAYITGTYKLPRPLRAGDRFRTQVGFLKGAKEGTPSVRMKLLLNGAVIDEISKSYDGTLRNWTVPLDDYAGQSGEFSLQVWGIPQVNYAWICWINPRIEQ